MRCPSCATENEPGRKFCHECGTRLAAGCPTCGATNQPDAKFCGECGTALSAVGTTPTTAAASATRPDGADGPVTERRVVSVLFADLVGFTTLAEGRDAEEVRELQDRYFATCRAVIDRYGGTLEKFIGDAVMAVWGAPRTLEDDAERAVRAALELVSAVATLRVDPDGPTLAARAAVMTGEAAVALRATDQGLVSGDLVNTASRLQGVAASGTVLIDEASHRATAAGIAAEPVGDQDLRGRETPVPAWRALRAQAMVRGRGRSDRLEPPFVGRDGELRLLKDLLHATDDERRARLVSVTGVAGIGKTRLAWELLKYIDGLAGDVYWHQGRSPAYGEGVAFWALAEMVRGRAGIAELDDAEVARAKLVAALETYVPDEAERRAMEPWLLALLGLGAAGEIDLAQAFGAARRLIERIAEQGLAVFVFEDLQWADNGLIDFIESILEWSRNHRILIITLARPELVERRPTWGAGQRNFSALHLEPLADGPMTALLDGVVPGLPRPFVRQVIERANGIPLFAVETIRMLIDEGRLVADGDRFRLEGEIDQLAVPESLRGLIGARIDGLTPPDRALVQDAAVLGLSFTSTALEALTGDSQEAIEPRLRSLVRREILAVDDDPGSPERGQYVFVQGLIREVAYETLSKKDRRVRHLAAARYFETLDSDELAGILAMHYRDAYLATPSGPEADALAAQARIALRGAADRASRLGSNALALDYLEKAVTVTVDSAELAAIREAGATAALRATKFDAAERLAREATEWYRSIGDLAGVARLSVRQTQPMFETGRTTEAIAVLEAAIAECAGLGSVPEVVALDSELARAFMLTVDPRAAETVERALVAGERLELNTMLIDTLVTKAGVLDLAGRRVEGIALLHGAIELAAGANAAWVGLRARANLANQLSSDDPRAGLATATVARDLARSLGQGDNFRWTSWQVAYSSIWIGDLDRALETVDEIAASDPTPEDDEGILMTRAFVAAFRGESDTAIELVSAADLAAPHFSRPGFISARHEERSRVLSLLGRFEEAYDRAVQAAELELSIWVARTALHPAAMLRDPARARRALEFAEAAPERGRCAAAIRHQHRAVVAALDGRDDEAGRAFAAATDLLRGLDLPRDLGVCSLEHATLVPPTVPAARAAAEQARAIFERLASPPLLERLRLTLDRWGPIGASGPASSVAPEVLISGTRRPTDD